MPLISFPPFADGLYVPAPIELDSVHSAPISSFWLARWFGFTVACVRRAGHFKLSNPEAVQLI